MVKPKFIQYDAWVRLGKEGRLGRIGSLQDNQGAVHNYVDGGDNDSWVMWEDMVEDGDWVSWVDLVPTNYIPVEPESSTKDQRERAAMNVNAAFEDFLREVGRAQMIGLEVRLIDSEGGGYDTDGFSVALEYQPPVETY